MNDTDLMCLARATRRQMRDHEAALGLAFPLHVRLDVALDAIEAGLLSGCLLEAAVGYLMLKEVLEAAASAGEERSGQHPPEARDQADSPVRPSSSRSTGTRPSSG